MRWAVVDSPIGPVGVRADGGYVVGVRFDAHDVIADWAGGAAGEAGEAGPDVDVLSLACRQLVEYFDGVRREFDVPIRAPRGSAFERSVWAAIADIPYGQTRGYGEIASAVGEPGGAQAVGLACNRNPLPILVACHRVIGADGKLVGFGGGVDKKRWLLSREAMVYLSQPW